MTDVNIAVEMLADAYEDRFDVALLVSGDSDLADLVSRLPRLFPAKRVVVAFPPRRESKALRKVASGYVFVDRGALLQNQLPDEVVKTDGTVLRRPAEWQ